MHSETDKNILISPVRAMTLIYIFKPEQCSTDLDIQKKFVKNVETWGDQ